MKNKKNRMGICWSDPPITPTTVNNLRPCRACGAWSKLEFCELCLQRGHPSAPPLQYPMANHYTYVNHYPQQPTYYPPYQTQPLAYISSPYPQQPRPTTSTLGNLATGFVVGALVEDMLDPN